jgi:TetR/AcrR family transcriptional regulator, cholesterol catabolism regulator
MDYRQRITEEAAEMFRTYGIRAVTMDMIASKMGISKRTIYEVFSDKDELLKGVLICMAEKQKELITRTMESSENAIAVIFKILEADRNMFQDMSPAFQEDMKRLHIEARMKSDNYHCEMPGNYNNTDILDRGIKEKLFRNDIQLEIVNMCLLSLFKSTMNQDLYPFNKFSRRDVIKNVFLNYMKGISTQEGLALINSYESKF